MMGAGMARLGNGAPPQRSCACLASRIVDQDTEFLSRIFREPQAHATPLVRPSPRYTSLSTAPAAPAPCGLQLSHGHLASCSRVCSTSTNILVDCIAASIHASIHAPVYATPLHRSRVPLAVAALPRLHSLSDHAAESMKTSYTRPSKRAQNPSRRSENSARPTWST